MKFFTILLSLVSISSVFSGDVTFSINVKNVVNKISENFISFEVDIDELIAMSRRGKSFKFLNEISPSYIRILNLSHHLNLNEKGEQSDNVNKSPINEIIRTLNFYKTIPVIVLNYDVQHFEPMHLLKYFKAAKNAGISKAIWQLGDDSMKLNSNVNIEKYIENLKTLKILCDSMKREQNLDWDVAGVAAHKQLKNENLPFQVSAMNFERVNSEEMISKTAKVKSILHQNVWVTLKNSSSEGEKEEMSTYDNCNHSCLIDGLKFAHLLGESSKKGFDVVFLENSLENSSAMKTAVTILHKKLIGTGVFATRTVKSSPDGKLSNLYSYCSKKPNGALTLMGINFANTRMKFNVRISTILDSNISIVQYLLSAQTGQVLLNNEKFSNDSTSTMKFKKLSKFSIPLTLPPYSIAFWTLKNVKIDDCANQKSHSEIPLKSISTSDNLLRNLVLSEMKSNQIMKNSRTKRQADQFLPSSPFEFTLPEMPKFKFPDFSMMSSASNSKPMVESLFNKNAEIYKANNDENIFQHSENPLLPNGDVFMTVAKSSLDSKLNPVYIDDEDKKPSNNRRKSKLTTTTTESSDYYFHDYADVIQQQEKTSKSSKSTIAKKSQNRGDNKKEIGELFEADDEDLTAGGLKNDDQVRNKGDNIELKTVIKELEPTYRQSKKALKQAKKKWDRSRIFELLKNAQVQEIDRDSIKDPNNYDIIDMADIEKPDYEEYDEDEDGFFSDSKRKRSKRNINSWPQMKNQITKFHKNEIFQSDEEESIENWMSGSHIFLQPSAEVTRDEPSVVKDVKSCENESTVIRAVNFFTRQLQKALEALDKTFVGCWEIILKPRETY